MTEKDIMNDYLSMIKGSLTGYAAIISETDNPQLLQTFQKTRDMDKQRQFKIYQAAKHQTRRQAIAILFPDCIQVYHPADNPMLHRWLPELTI